MLHELEPCVQGTTEGCGQRDEAENKRLKMMISIITAHTRATICVCARI